MLLNSTGRLDIVSSTTTERIEEIKKNLIKTEDKICEIYETVQVNKILQDHESVVLEISMGKEVDDQSGEPQPILRKIYTGSLGEYISIEGYPRKSSLAIENFGIISSNEPEEDFEITSWIVMNNFLIFLYMEEDI